MMRAAHNILILLAGLALSAPAAAQDSASVSEPSNLAIVMIGLAGLIIGRQAAKRSRKKGPEQE